MIFGWSNVFMIFASCSSLEAICFESRDVPLANFLIAHGDLGPFDRGDRSYNNTLMPEIIIRITGAR